LNAHPQVEAKGEILSWLRDHSYDELLDEGFSCTDANVHCCGFKIFYYHPQDDPSKRVWELLRDIPELKVIHLTRDNILRTVLSQKIASQTEVWLERVNSDTKNLEKEVVLCQKELERQFVQTRSWISEFTQYFASHDVCNINYETLVSSPLSVTAALYDFLGVDSIAAHTELRKQNTEPIESLIKNYVDLKEYFIESEWSSFFED